MQPFIVSTEWFFVSYFAALHLFYFSLSFLAYSRMAKYVRSRRESGLPEVYAGYEPGISVVVPVHNESSTILATISALRGQVFQAVQIIVVNDGSTDNSLKTVLDAYEMVPVQMPPRTHLPSKVVRGVYRATGGEDILLIDKPSGQKADANNAGINYARYERVCTMDGDSVLEPASLHRSVRLFIERPETIATGGTIFVLNGCRVGQDGFIKRVGLANNYWGLVQTVEYIRAFLFGRLGWATVNALPIISGAFGMYNRDAIVAVGGFRTDAIGEDMELTLRLHRYALDRGVKYRMDFVPEPVCWTEVPESMMALQQQRVRWHQGLCESLWMNRGLMKKPSVIGWVAFPFLVVFECLSPLLEIAGYTFAMTSYGLGYLSDAALFAFLFMAIGLGILLSVATLAMEELGMQNFPKFRYVLVLFFYAILENFGFRQMHAAWRCIGFMRWAFRREHDW